MKLKDLFRRKKAELIEFVGNYTSFAEAEPHCMGYASANILEKNKDSLLQVKNGTAVHERDTVLFDHIEYSWPLLSSLLYVAARNMGSLNVLDFGGSLGSTYYQNRRFFKDLAVTWNIVEQENHVACGQEYFADDELKFYYTIDECVQEKRVNVVLLSSVIQYIAEPYAVIENILEHDIDFIIFDRTGVTESAQEVVLVQNVPAWIYACSYPVWALSEQKLLAAFRDKYSCIEEWQSTIDGPFKVEALNCRCNYKGYLLEKIGR